jgi:TusA-related sulfurtransferase
MRPVSKPAREAEQMAEGEYILVKRMPVSAIRSIVGVCKSFDP